MGIKVDFDLTMSILAHNLYRVFANALPGYSHETAQSLFQKFIHNRGEVEIDPSLSLIKMRKKRNLPAMLTAMDAFKTYLYAGCRGARYNSLTLAIRNLKLNIRGGFSP